MNAKNRPVAHSDKKRQLFYILYDVYLRSYLLYCSIITQKTYPAIGIKLEYIFCK